MKTKLLLTALILVMSVFILPLTVSAEYYYEVENVEVVDEDVINADITLTDVEPPIVFAEIYGTILRIQIERGFYEVEAVFVNESRFEIYSDSILSVNISNYIAADEIIAIYAVDYEGNVSETVYLMPSSTEIILQLLESLLSPPPTLNPFTPDGQATVLDRATGDDGKDFFTFVTPAGNIFYLIVDHHRTSNNVYFLNAVTEMDLLSLAYASGEAIQLYTVSGITTPPPEPVVQETEPKPPPQEESPQEQQVGMSAGTIVFLLIIFAVVGGAGYYFKILRPRQQKQMHGDEEYSDDEYDDLPDNDDDDVEEVLDENQEETY